MHTFIHTTQAKLFREIFLYWRIGLAPKGARGIFGRLVGRHQASQYMVGIHHAGPRVGLVVAVHGRDSSGSSRSQVGSRSTWLVFIIIIKGLEW